MNPIHIKNPPAALRKWIITSLPNQNTCQITKKSKAPEIIHRRALQVVIVKEGHGLAFLNGRPILLNRGDILIFSKRIKHIFIGRPRIKIICSHLPKDYGESDRIICQQDTRSIFRGILNKEL